MRIGINALYVIASHNGGTETYLRGLLEELLKIDTKNEYYLFINRYSQNNFQYKFSNLKTIVCAIDGRRRSLRVLYEQIFLPLLVKKYHLDVLHSPGFVSPLFAPCAKVVTIHDLFHLHFPQWISRRKRIYWKMMIPLSIRRSNQIITVSETIKQELIAKYPTSNQKISVTYEGAKFQINQKHIHLNEIGLGHLSENPFFFWVGTLAQHKNILTLLKGFTLFLKSNPTHKKFRLVLAGGLGSSILNTHHEVQTYLESFSLRKNVILLPRISDEQLLALYQHARGFIFPSLYEGFGLPLLEAMSQGCPVISTRCGSLSEIAGNAALYVEDPLDPKDFANKISLLVHNDLLCEHLKQAGFARSQVFTFHDAAKKTIAVYESAHQNRKNFPG